ncbi:hypothetical protein J0X19_22000 [Hymenobacter sp. BT186]|uniref:Uncharacterized protein n=1 Tax=Hymenobacter telluris TaxID=2816474 RepID=A0A939F0L4_9BACT|nr:hypothetical protein [Hymenobacter telluris]MBO0360649.1 hypothetical protein [Hymenobacter telluris]MBW3376676.1 hypothetical protein [Hymenobacter norwichensis]
MEQKLSNALTTPGFISVISGPSKCGKTVLCEKVIGVENMLLITGAGITTIDVFWSKLRQELSTERSSSSAVATTLGGTITGTVTATGSIPLLAKASGSVAANTTATRQQTLNRIFDDRNSKALFKLLRDENLTLVVDDFHYADAALQKILAQEFKEAAREGTRIVLVSVPHRADQAIRANRDLRGRLRLLNITYWSEQELIEIPKRGFRQLGIILDEATLSFLVKESLSSPQLMQTLCLDLCYNNGYFGEQIPPIRKSLRAEELKELLVSSSSNTDCSTAYTILKTGPKPRGSQRNTYMYSGGQTGDIYAIVLAAIASGEAALAFSYEDLKGRIESLIDAGYSEPRGSDITSTLIQMDTSIRTRAEEDRVIEYDKEKETLNILDPYFLYYLRWATK